MKLKPWPLLPLLTLLLACNPAPPPPALEWDAAPTTVVVEVANYVGLTPMLAAWNHLYPARIWGDGRLVWTEDGAQGQRRVLTATLTPAQLRAFLQTAADAGFFGWEDLYEDPTVMDAGTECLKIQLTTTTKEVCEYFAGAPTAFHTLLNDVTTGLNVAGTDYVPVRGYLTTYPSGQNAPTTAVRWPAEVLGFTLAEATTGRWVEGAALAQAWQLVNENPWGNVVADSDGAHYQIAVQIPGLSQAAPPEEGNK